MHVPLLVFACDRSALRPARRKLQLVHKCLSKAQCGGAGGVPFGARVIGPISGLVRRRLPRRNARRRESWAADVLSCPPVRIKLCRGTRSEALGQSLPDHLRAAHWNGFDAAVITLQGRPTPEPCESGRRLYVEMTFAIVEGDAGGEALCSVAMARDATGCVERERAASRPC
jgi:hypothetical protein